MNLLDKSQYPNIKFQSVAYFFGICDLGFVWNLSFGIFNLVLL